MKVGIIGAGTMGSGIAQAFAQVDGYEVCLCDINEEFASNGKLKISKNFEKRVAKGKMAKEDADKILARIHTGVKTICSDCDLVVEAAIENMEIKKQTFKELGAICKADCVFATNTSSLSITEIGAGLDRPVIGMHFFNPAPVMKLVEVIAGLNTPVEIVDKVKKISEEIGKIPVSMGVDTWGVDFVLLDKDDKVLGNTVGYRDHRTEGMDEEVYKTISLKDLYARTGIQKAIYNTVYQLMAVKKKHPEYLEQAETLLHVPDYFHFLLTGEKTCEYTEATTGQLVCPTTKDWDYELIDMLGYPRKIFQKLIMPSTSIGHLTDAVKEAVGFDLEVVAPATHDTGSAVLAVPANDDDFIYISSGTWSLMGIERKEADCSEKSCEMNFTNEGGYAGRFRYLKNIMGLWMIQSVRHEFDDAYSFAQICEMAEEAKDFPSRVNANDECFLSPENMTKEVQDYCRRTGQQVPETLGEIATVIYTSLADCYAKIAKEIEEMTGRTYSRIHIVGGGSNAGYLNELTAKATKKEIHAGPGEATAIGNITAQMLKAEEFKTIEEARTTIHESFGIKVYKA